MVDNRITVIDDEGNEVEMEIVLTFDGNNGRQYVLVKDTDPDREEVYAFTYDEEGNLDPVEDEEESEMCAEVLSAFQKEDNGSEEA